MNKDKYTWTYESYIEIIIIMNNMIKIINEFGHYNQQVFKENFNIRLQTINIIYQQIL